MVLDNSFFKRRVRPNSITTSKPTYRHAEGYYITVESLYSDFMREPKLFKDIMSFGDYLNSLLRHGIKAEFKLYEYEDDKMSFSRKMTIAKRFAKIIDVKTSLLLFASPLFYIFKSLK